MDFSLSNELIFDIPSPIFTLSFNNSSVHNLLAPSIFPFLILNKYSLLIFNAFSLSNKSTLTSAFSVFSQAVKLNKLNKS